MKSAAPKVIFINIPHPVLQEKLEAAGYACEMAPTEPREAIEARIHEYTGLIINSRFSLDRSFLEKATALKFIGRVGAGLESIDTEFAALKGIRCFNSPEGNRDAVAEHAVGLLLAVLNHIPRANAQVRQQQWLREANRGVEILGKTVGIIGFGNMGNAFAQRLSGFGANVLAYDKYKTGFATDAVREVTLQTIFQETDILSFHVPLTEETFYYFDEAFMRSFKKPIWLLNTARGKVVSTRVLVQGLREGRVLGAGLDVLEYEDVSFDSMQTDELPPPLTALMNMDNVVFTPHVAGWTAESKIKLARVLAEKICTEFPLKRH